MSRTDEFEREHQWAAANLPWYVNGRLPPAEQLRLSAHLQGCAACRTDLEVEQRLAQGLSASPVVDYAPQASLARMMQAIDQSERRRGRLPWRRRAAGTAPTQPRASLLWVVVGQAAGLTVLAIAVAWLALRPTPDTSYRTLSSPAVAGDAQLQVVFVDHTTVSQMRATLAGVGGIVVGGPSRAGAFRVSIHAAQQVDAPQDAAIAAALARLEHDPSVLYVAALGRSGSP